VSVPITVIPAQICIATDAPTVKEVAIIPGGGSESHLHRDIIIRFHGGSSKGQFICTTGYSHCTMFCFPRGDSGSMWIFPHSQAQRSDALQESVPGIATMQSCFPCLTEPNHLCSGSSFSSIWWMPGLLRRAICTGSGLIKSRYVLRCIKGSMMPSWQPDGAPVDLGQQGQRIVLPFQPPRLHTHMHSSSRNHGNRRYGHKPDIFLNDSHPNWPEIQEALLEFDDGTHQTAWQTVLNCCRVFHQKIKPC